MRGQATLLPSSSSLLLSSTFSLSLPSFTFLSNYYNHENKQQIPDLDARAASPEQRRRGLRASREASCRHTSLARTTLHRMTAQGNSACERRLPSTTAAAAAADTSHHSLPCDCTATRGTSASTSNSVRQQCACDGTTWRDGPEYCAAQTHYCHGASRSDDSFDFGLQDYTS